MSMVPRAVVSAGVSVIVKAKPVSTGRGLGVRESLRVNYECRSACVSLKAEAQAQEYGYWDLGSASSVCVCVYMCA